MAKLDITPHERSALRAAAHPLRPVVLIGERGLSEPVLKEIDLNLKAHELIKVRVAGEDRQTRETLLATICERLDCAAVHHLGRILVLYRPNTPSPDDLPQTRALRKPSEPYTPKKMAAAGLSRNRIPARRRPARPAPGIQRRLANPADDHDTGPAQRAGRGGGSMLTLRAGMRKGNTRRRQR